MIRIIVEDGLDVILEAYVDVPKRKVVSLLVEPSHPLRTIYVAEALLAMELEREMARLEGEGDTLKREQPTRALTNEQMARAMGLVRCRALWTTACSACWGATIDWMRGSGQVLSGWCNACLPTAYDDHLIEQAEMDRLVEANDTLKREQPTGTRPDVPTCEGGCE
jgi:hypothetical protein